MGEQEIEVIRGTTASCSGGHTTKWPNTFSQKG